MPCSKVLKGFTPFKVVSLVAVFLGVVTLATSIAYEKWDDLNIIYSTGHLIAHQNLWKLTIENDPFTFGNVGSFIEEKKRPDVYQWRATVRNLQLAAVGSGFLGFTFLFLSALIQRPVLNIICRFIGLLTTQCGSYMITIGAMLYKYQYKGIFTAPLKTPSSQFPIDDYVIAEGWFIAWGAAGLYIFGSTINIMELAVKTGKAIRSNTVDEESSTAVQEKDTKKGVVTITPVESIETDAKKKIKQNNK